MKTTCKYTHSLILCAVLAAPLANAADKLADHIGFLPEGPAITVDDIAIAMGHYHFTGPDDTETKVEYTKGYVKLPDERVMLFLQDSSLPYGAQ